MTLRIIERNEMEDEREAACAYCLTSFKVSTLSISHNSITYEGQCPGCGGYALFTYLEPPPKAELAAEEL